MTREEAVERLRIAGGTEDGEPLITDADVEPLSPDSAAFRRMDYWVRDLRSGRYAQAKELLFDGTGYCCLGVYLAKIAGYPNETLSDQPMPSSIGVCGVAQDTLPISKRVQSALAALNDGASVVVDGENEELPPASFSEIADILDAIYLCPNQQPEAAAAR